MHCVVGGVLVQLGRCPVGLHRSVVLLGSPRTLFRIASTLL